ncbi:MAG TPA: FtsW/RodA/SpoVE family cell cycle protein [Candidatus Nitrosocosmicus sp.]|nr:FtsW/RodA/SpoVE family cell cycle protein [Candidatus Nitrosocosmicus sp.]
MNRRFDFYIFFSLVGLSIFSLFNIFGISHSLFQNQAVYILVGFVALFIFWYIGINFFKFNSKTFYWMAVILLVITYIIGFESRGSRRWIDFYFFNFQSSEFLKIFFILYLSQLFSSKFELNFQSLIKNSIIFVPPIFLVYKQPDLGNAIIYFLIYMSILFFRGYSIKYFLIGFMFLTALIPISWNFLKQYQKNRLLSFINPEKDPSGISYNLIQAVITVGSGGLIGKGLGLGTQSRFSFLPENHTDFAFASLVEQFGFIGGFVVILLIGIIIFRLIKKAIHYQHDTFKFLFLIGVITFLLTQAVINIGMNLGIFPVAGIALPLITYGGSSIITTMMLLGLAIGL